MLTRAEIQALVSETGATLTPARIDEMAIPSYLHWNPAIRWIIRKRLKVIAKLLRQCSTRQYLDFGCGLGLLAHEMAGHCERILACDIELGPLRTMVRRHRLPAIIPVTPEQLEAVITPDSLDAVVAADVLEHVEHLGPCLNRLARLLVPSGRLVISGPTENQIYKLGRIVAGFSGDYHMRSIYDIERTLQALGWRPITQVAIPGWRPIQFFRISVWLRPPVDPSAAITSIQVERP